MTPITQTSAASLSPLEESNMPGELAPAPELDPERERENQSELGEFARLEALLSARTRSHGGLQRELERRDRLFREALVRMSTSTSQEFSALRAGYEAAVARAIEAEVGRAELTFALDETRTQLTAAQVAGPAPQAPRASTGLVTTPGMYAADAARLTAEHAASQRKLEQLRGELSGLRARAAEAEQAWQAAYAQNQKLNQRLATSQERVNGLRTESAELTLLAQTRAARIAELTQAAAFDQQEIRTLRAQVAAANAAQVAQSEARESDRQLWSERLQQHEEREQAAWKAAASAVARSEARLREFLSSLEEPLRQLDSSLDALNSAGPTRAQSTQPDAFLDVSAEARAPETEPPPATAPKSASAANGRRIADELANERDRRTKLVAAVRALQAATQSGEPTKPWIEELVELVSESRPSARRRS